MLLLQAGLFHLTTSLNPCGDASELGHGFGLNNPAKILQYKSCGSQHVRVGMMLPQMCLQHDNVILTNMCISRFQFHSFRVWIVQSSCFEAFCQNLTEELSADAQEAEWLYQMLLFVVVI